jgi:hypothetical protein
MKNPDIYAPRESERVAPYEALAADPEYLRCVGDQWAHAWVYPDPNPKRTLMECLQPDFWRNCLDRGIKRGSIIELRLGPPEELRTRRICICTADRHKGSVTLSLEMEATKDGSRQFKVVSHPEAASAAA